jgi:hypothetical protein
MATDKDARIRLMCECGAVLVARLSQAGRKGRCRRCGRILDIPSPEDVVALEEVEGEGEGEAIEEICSVCQTPLADDEPRTTCNSCGLPFHPECWAENQGCSAYGCANVNALRSGPDISLGDLSEAPPMIAPVPKPETEQTPTSLAEDIPWDYVLLGATSLGCLFSLMTCGLPSLIVIAASMLYSSQKPAEERIVLIVCIVLSAIGALFGMGCTLLFWSL